MKKIILLALYLVVYSFCFSQTDAKQINNIDDYSIYLFQKQKELLEFQINETQNIINQIDTLDIVLLFSYNNMLEKLNYQLEQVNTNGSNYYYDGKKTIFEVYLIGEWFLSDYNDNIERDLEQKKELEQQIIGMRESVKLFLNSDFTFERIGFTSEKETGKWSINETGDILIFKEVVVNYKEEIKIIKLTNNELVFEVTEILGETPNIIRLTFSKQN